MSKKSKKNNKNIVEELPPKSQCKMLSETLDKNNMDHTQYFPFVSEDFEKLGSRSLEDATEPVLEKIAADYKKLLISTNSVFWSTCAFNSYLQKSLDSFLKYAKKLRFSSYSIRKALLLPDKSSYSEHQYIKRNHTYLEWMQEIFRLVFLLYTRMSRSGDKLSQQERELNTGKTVFENWLFDSVKGFDLVAIYGFENLNKEALRSIVRGFYELNPEYYEDFGNAMVFMNKLLKKSVGVVVDAKKRDRLLGGKEELNAQDFESRAMNLVSLLDLSYIFNDVFVYFPMKCKEALFLNDDITTFMENLYYEIDGFRVIVKREEENLLPLISQIMSNVCGFFKECFNFLIDASAKKYINENTAKKFQAKLEKVLFNLGKMMYGSKKDPINLGLMRHLLRSGFDLAGFSEKLPSFLKIGEGNNQEKMQILLVTFESLKEELKLHDISEKESSESEEEPEEKQAKEEKPSVENNPKEAEEINNDSKEAQQNKDEKQEKVNKIKYTEVIVGKKEKKLDIMSQNEAQAAADFIKNQMELYDDEYDDTFEVYNEGRLIVEKNQLDPDSEDDFKVNEHHVNDNQYYEDEKDDDYVGNKHSKNDYYLEEYHTQKEYYPKTEKDGGENKNYENRPRTDYKNDNYQRKNYVNTQGFRKNYNDNYSKEGPYNDKDSYKNDNSQGFRKNYNENYSKEGPYHDKDSYKKETNSNFREKDNTKERNNYDNYKDNSSRGSNFEKKVYVKKEEEESHVETKPIEKQQSSGSNNYNNRKKYQQDKSFKNKASYKRKY